MGKKVIEKIEFPNEYKVLGADLSLKRPSFCLISFKKEDGKTVMTDIQFKTIDNKNDKKKCHGELLEEIRRGFIDIAFMRSLNTFFVRETEIMHMKVPSERSLSKVVGLMDMMLWKISHKEWFSIYPTTVKKLITGSGKAEKNQVAKDLEYYIGKQDYKCDDESDAAAVAIAWLIEQGQIKQKESKDG